MYISKDNLNFFVKIKEDGEEISLWSDSVANFFNISHNDELKPLLEKLHQKYPNCLIPHKEWSDFRKMIYTVFYVLNKEGCTVLCENLKAKPSIKKKFLDIINNLSK